MFLNDLELMLLKQMIENQLEKNWSLCDQFGSGSKKYENLSDECRILKQLAEKFDIKFSEHIIARF